MHPQFDEHGSPIWGFADAWLLDSIGDGSRRKGVTLSDVIGSADARNHAIPTEAEASVAFGRLVASGLIAIDDGRFWLTEVGHAVVRTGSGGLTTRSSSLLPALGTLPLRDGLHAFAPGEFDAAYRAYTRRMR